MLQLGYINARNQCNWQSVWNYQVISNLFLHIATQNRAVSNTSHYLILNSKQHTLKSCIFPVTCKSVFQITACIQSFHHHFQRSAENPLRSSQAHSNIFFINHYIKHKNSNMLVTAAITKMMI